MGSYCCFASDELRVATFNIGMLDKISPVPFLDHRKSLLMTELKKTLLKENIDVLAIQESWPSKFINTFNASKSSYIALSHKESFTLPFLGHSTGLLFIVKKSLNPKTNFIPFKRLNSYICLWGLVCKRGLLKLTITKNNQKITLFNSHLTPTPELTSYRKDQIDLLKEHIDASVEENGISLFLSDTNISQKFGELKPNDHGTKQQWDNNGRIYDYFLEKNTRCIDTYVFATQSYTYTMNRKTNLTAKISPSAGKAPSQRNDWIILCTQKADQLVTGHKLIFTNTYSSKGVHFHLSDHYGVMATIKL